jgi:hypothetical protein
MADDNNTDVPNEQDTQKVIAFLLKQTAKSQQIQLATLQQLVTNEIKSDDIRGDNLDFFTLKKGENMFYNSVMIARAGMVRISINVAMTTKMIAIVDGVKGYLNTGQTLSPNCIYVFDVPLNPNNGLNLCLDFDDSQSTMITVNSIRLQEIR